MIPADLEKIKKKIDSKTGRVTFFQLAELQNLGFGNIERLPYSMKILLESALRNFDGYAITVEDLETIASSGSGRGGKRDVAFKPGRVILQDFTGVPVLVDLAAMRSAMHRLGGDYERINPLVPCDLVVDHSVRVDAFGTKNALEFNVKGEFKRNWERYEFLKWGQSAFGNFRVVPPATGIVHQVNLEYLTQGVLLKKSGDELTVYPDSLIGTDSHTTMVNGLGVAGWGVGGIEAEAVMLGEPLFMVLPEVLGVRLKGRLKEGVTATDLVLTITEVLRKKGVVGMFVEYYGEGLAGLSLPDRATVANMAPEYGATMGYFPVDREVLKYYRMTGRTEEQLDLIERYMKGQGMFYEAGSAEPDFTETLEIDLGGVEPCVAGPKRPQDRVPLGRMKVRFFEALRTPLEEKGFGIEKAAGEAPDAPAVTGEGGISHGSVVIAAITSCTNTSNPSVMVAAGLLAKKAVEKGLRVKELVKTSLAPGSRVVTEYLTKAGLQPFLEKLGFYTVGFGCTTCIGNSGPLPEWVAQAIKEGNLVVASILSGNRNFEGRVNPLVRANYLASPPLVIAFALAGRADVDMTREPLGKGHNGEDVYLRDIWPTDAEIRDVIQRHVKSAVFFEKYQNVFVGDEAWDSVYGIPSDLYPWDAESTYIQEPPFFLDFRMTPDPVVPIREVRVLGVFGDSITTDHISPAGSIDPESPAGRYLAEKGVLKKDFNSYGSRRGNDKVMVRGTFANERLRNLLVPDKEGNWTVYFPKNEVLSFYEAAMLYQGDRTPLMILAGKEYGAGSSRDWAAKGTALLGIRVVLAESYERIHRDNLVRMGVLPLQFGEGDSRASLGLEGDEIYDFEDLSDGMKPHQEVTVVVRKKGQSVTKFKAVSRLDTLVEIEYYKNGGILQLVLRKLAKQK